MKREVKNMKNINPIKLSEFRNEMMEIFREKFNKYTNTWKHIDIEYLMFKLKEQLKRIYLDNNHNKSNKNPYEYVDYYDK